jgi:hypothetical protein
MTAFREGEDARTARLVFPSFSMGPVQTESALSCFRLEKAITNWKPGRIKTDQTTNFWTVYKNVADEHDSDMVSKYVGDLDTSLLFVSPFTFLARLIRLNQVLFLC